MRFSPGRLDSAQTGRGRQIVKRPRLRSHLVHGNSTALASIFAHHIILRFRVLRVAAGVAQLAEHNVANVVVVGSNPITRSWRFAERRPHFTYEGIRP